MIKRSITLLIFTAIIIFAVEIGNAQVVSFNQDSVKILMKKEHSFSLNLNTQGGGVGFRTGHHLTGYKKLMYETEFVMMKDPKEMKSTSYYYQMGNAKDYLYGKLNYLFILRGGMGIQNVISSKPYWGGVEVRNFYYGGVDLGFTKPVYLYIVTDYNPINNTAVITSEKYDPSQHNIDNIYGRAPFTDGLNKVQIYPGIYGKYGYNFEFGQQDEKIRCLEVGINIDAFPKPIPLMAYQKSNYFFLTFYISYSFGKRLVN